MAQPAGWAAWIGRVDGAQVRARLPEWPPVVAWLAATTVVVVVAAAAGWNPFAAEATWARWDSATYLSIARSGYALAPCLHVPGAWCGSMAWFPAYPWIVGALYHLGLPLAGTALAVSWLALFGTLVVIWREFLVGQPRGPAAAALLYAAFAPGAIYAHAIFPLSLLSLCTVTFLALLQRGRWVAAGIAGACAALAYPVGVVAAPAAALWLLTDRAARPRERFRRAVLILGMWAAALGGLVADQQLETGHWDGFRLVQSNYRHHLRDPLAAVGGAFVTLAHKSLLGRPGAAALQTLLLVFVILCVLVLLVAAHASRTRLTVLVSIWAVAAWLLPHTITNVSAYRGEAALLPIAVVMWRLPRAILAVATSAAIILSVPMELLFLRGILK